MHQRASEIYSDTFSDIRSDPILLLPLFLANLIYFGLTMAVGASLAANTMVRDLTDQGLAATHTVEGGVLLVALVGSLAQFMAYCMLQCMAVETVTEGQTSLGSSLRLLLYRFVPFLATSLFVGVIFFLIGVGGMLIAANMGLGGFVAYMLLILVSALFVSLALPAVVYNELGPVEAVVDSFNKVKANFGRVLAFFLLTVALAIGVAFVTGIVSVVLGLAGSIITIIIAIWFPTVVAVALTRLYGDIDAEEKQRQAEEKQRQQEWQERIASQTVRPLDQF